MDNTCRNYRFYQRFSVGVGDVRNVLAIGKACGPGYLEIWSPDAFVGWTVVQTGDGKADPEDFRTGPSSHSGIYLPHGGELTGEVFGITQDKINPYNGAFLRQQSEPEVRAKFYPGLTQRDYVQSQRFAVRGNFPGSDGPGIQAGQILDFCYTPHFARTGAVSLTPSGNVDVVNGLDGVTRQLRGVNVTPGAFPFTLSAWEFLRITASANIPIPALQVLWDERLEAVN